MKYFEYCLHGQFQYAVNTHDKTGQFQNKQSANMTKIQVY